MNISLGYFNNLPAEIIIYIFKYLQQDAIAQCSMVSKHFNAITNNSCLWKCWHLHKFTMTEKIFQKLFYFKTERVSISYAQVSILVLSREIIKEIIKSSYTDSSRFFTHKSRNTFE